MRNDERYGKGKSWSLIIVEDGILMFQMDVQAYSYKDHLEITTTSYEDTDEKQVPELLHHLAESLERVHSGEIIPEWIAYGDDVRERGDADWPF